LYLCKLLHGPGPLGCAGPLGRLQSCRCLENHVHNFGFTSIIKKYSQGEPKIGHSEPVAEEGLKENTKGQEKSLFKVFLFDEKIILNHFKIDTVIWE
jgi:hypothetical protein